MRVLTRRRLMWARVASSVGKPPGRAPHDRNLRERRAVPTNINFSEIKHASAYRCNVKCERKILVSITHQLIYLNHRKCDALKIIYPKHLNIVTVFSDAATSLIHAALAGFTWKCLCFDTRWLKYTNADESRNALSCEMKVHVAHYAAV